MRRWLVAILAVTWLAGCGVGMDGLEYEPDGGLAASSSQALDGTTPQAPATPTNGNPTATSTQGVPGPVDPSAVGLPQDPIPLHDGRPPAVSSFRRGTTSLLPTH